MKICMISLAAILFVGSGCATVRGDKQKVKFETDPAGASLVVDGGAKLTTPAQLELKRVGIHKVDISKDGYQPITFSYSSQFDGASLTDLAMPGGSALAGLSVATGSDKSFNSLRVIKLEKASGTAAMPAQLYEYRGGLYPKAEFERLVLEEQNNRDRFGQSNN